MIVDSDYILDFVDNEDKTKFVRLCGCAFVEEIVGTDDDILGYKYPIVEKRIEATSFEIIDESARFTISGLFKKGFGVFIKDDETGLVDTDEVFSQVRLHVGKINYQEMGI